MKSLRANLLNAIDNLSGDNLAKLARSLLAMVPDSALYDAARRNVPIAFDDLGLTEAAQTSLRESSSEPLQVAVFEITDHQTNDPETTHTVTINRDINSQAVWVDCVRNDRYELPDILEGGRVPALSSRLEVEGLRPRLGICGDGEEIDLVVQHEGNTLFAAGDAPFGRGNRMATRRAFGHDIHGLEIDIPGLEEWLEVARETVAERAYEKHVEELGDLYECSDGWVTQGDIMSRTYYVQTEDDGPTQRETFTLEFKKGSHEPLFA